MSDLVFDRDSADKVARTLELLEALHSHPAVRGKVCLHGGTALNLFVLAPERLSLDADINYVGACEPEFFEEQDGSVVFGWDWVKWYDGQLADVTNVSDALSEIADDGIPCARRARPPDSRRDRSGCQRDLSRRIPL
ncbi:nucleotidyl transferase AbiEii/AbiGii toxin family protein [Adlercreutzia sp. ZJ154]|uniref:nucleotidyl transferase AbiEii/AbiGii toxin family protein n=1 Tax=Adlercreutzia sp. ZJ154 TaxID=2709790 RepID=UPI0013EAACE2|nr:nucleotidyl transferase AbiEii/AbiGii toxin family protein [Adlercreutzia sp. ZJ154]